MGPWTFHVLKSVLNFLLTWGFSAWGVHFAFAFPLPMSPFGRKLDKNWPNGSKNKNLSFLKKNLVRFWRALKRQVFDQKRHFFDIFGFPPTGYFTFWPKNLKKWHPLKFWFADRILTLCIWSRTLQNDIISEQPLIL